jgi:hypothetical protein
MTIDRNGKRGRKESSISIYGGKILHNDFGPAKIERDKYYCHLVWYQANKVQNIDDSKVSIMECKVPHTKCDIGMFTHFSLSWTKNNLLYRIGKPALIIYTTFPDAHLEKYLYAPYAQPARTNKSREPLIYQNLQDRGHKNESRIYQCSHFQKGLIAELFNYNNKNRNKLTTTLSCLGKSKNYTTKTPYLNYLLKVPGDNLTQVYTFSAIDKMTTIILNDSSYEYNSYHQEINRISTEINLLCDIDKLGAEHHKKTLISINGTPCYQAYRHNDIVGRVYLCKSYANYIPHLYIDKKFNNCRLPIIEHDYHCDKKIDARKISYYIYFSTGNLQLKKYNIDCCKFENGTKFLKSYDLFYKFGGVREEGYVTMAEGNNKVFMAKIFYKSGKVAKIIRCIITGNPCRYSKLTYHHDMYPAKEIYNINGCLVQKKCYLFGELQNVAQ